MSNNKETFEVRVEVKKKGSRHYSYHTGSYIERTIVKMFHIDAKNHRKAMKIAKKYGRPIRSQSPDIEKMMGNMEGLELAPQNPYSNAIVMDEFVWERKGRREQRINNNKKHKDRY